MSCQQDSEQAPASEQSPTQHPPAAAAIVCVICRDCLDEGSETVALACGHVFHGHCATEWLKRSATCPQCRKRLRSAQRDLTRIYLSFGGDTGEVAGGGLSDDELPGLAELRRRLASATSDSEEARRQLKQVERRDAKLRRYLNQRQRQLDERSRELNTCHESMAQQEDENRQLMELLAREHQEQREMRRVRADLEAAGLENRRLEDRLRQAETRGEDQASLTAELSRRLTAAQQEAAELEDRLQEERETIDGLTEEILAREAETLELQKRLNCGHEEISQLSDRLGKSELRSLWLTEQLLMQQFSPEIPEFASLPAQWPKLDHRMVESFVHSSRDAASQQSPDDHEDQGGDWHQSMAEAAAAGFN